MEGQLYYKADTLITPLVLSYKVVLTQNAPKPHQKVTLPTPKKPSTSPEQLRWFRLQNSGLIKPFASNEEAARSLFGVQAQILPAAALSLWNRTPRGSHQHFEDKLFQDRSLVKLWGQRGTLHLYDTNDWPLLFGALSGRPTWFERQAVSASARRRYQAALDKARALLETQGHITRDALREHGVPEDFLSSWGGIFADLVRRGLACHGPQEGGEGKLCARSHWSPNLAWEPPAAEAANLSIARRVIKTYGPISERDFAYWRGASTKDAKRWFELLRPELTQVDLGTSDAQWIFTEDLERLQAEAPDQEAWPIKVLYRFDPLLLAHKDKTWVVPQKHYNKVWRPAGHIEGVILEHGVAVSTWRYERTAKSLSFELSPFSRLSTATKDTFWEKAEEIAGFFNLALTR